MSTTVKEAKCKKCHERPPVSSVDSFICESCIDDAFEALGEIAVSHGSLHEEILYGSRNGIRYAASGRDILGGEPMIHFARAATNLDACDPSLLDGSRGFETAANVLQRLEDQVRRATGQPRYRPTNLLLSVQFLQDNLYRACGHLFAVKMLSAIGATAHRLEKLLGGGIRTEKTNVPCTEFGCEGWLERVWLPVGMEPNEDALRNRHACRDCFTAYDDNDFDEAKKARAVYLAGRIAKRREEISEDAEWLTPSQAALLSGRHRSSIFKAAKRGEVVFENVEYESYGRTVSLMYVWWPDVKTWMDKRKSPVVTVGEAVGA